MNKGLKYMLKPKIPKAKIPDTGFGNNWGDTTHKTQSTKPINEWDCIKLKSPAQQRSHHQQSKEAI